MNENRTTNEQMEKHEVQLLTRQVATTLENMKFNNGMKLEERETFDIKFLEYKETSAYHSIGKDFSSTSTTRWPSLFCKQSTLSFLVSFHYIMHLVANRLG